MKIFSRKNGYFKFYTSTGKQCRIKIEGNIADKEVLIKFREKDEIDWQYHAPRKNFKSNQEVIWFICSNVERDNIIFEVFSTNSLPKN